MRKMQIGVMGSMADLKYSKQTEKLAEEIGYRIAKSGAVLVFGAEKDSDSLSTAACRGAKRASGLTVGVTYGKGLEVYEKIVDVIIASGLERGGGRELTLALSCDAIIALNGGSGTLTEIAIAYQANIPIVVMENTGGWSKKLAGTYLDGRKRIKIEGAQTAKEAVDTALKLAKNRKAKNSRTLFLAGVHGDEKIGITVLEDLQQEGMDFSWMRGNEQALKASKRYIDADLNRIAPGNSKGKKYEIKRAAELVQSFSRFEYVIDIHGTTERSGIFTIVTKSTFQNLLLAGCLPIKNIVIWESEDKKKTTGPLVSFAKCGVEIECGPQNSEKVKKLLKEKLMELINNGIQLEKSNLLSKNIFKVYGKVVETPQISLRDYRLATVNGESFYPLLVGQYPDMACYKMKVVDSIKEITS